MNQTKQNALAFVFTEGGISKLNKWVKQWSTFLTVININSETPWQEVTTVYNEHSTLLWCSSHLLLDSFHRSYLRQQGMVLRFGIKQPGQSTLSQSGPGLEPRQQSLPLASPPPSIASAQLCLLITAASFWSTSSCLPPSSSSSWSLGPRIQSKWQHEIEEWWKDYVVIFL